MSGEAFLSFVNSQRMTSLALGDRGDRVRGVVPSALRADLSRSTMCSASGDESRFPADGYERLLALQVGEDE